MKQIKLSEEQKKYHEAVKWLLDPVGNRARGRTFLMAMVFIELAIEDRGRWVTFFDHFPDKQATDYFLTSEIDRIVNSSDDLKGKIEIGRNRLRCH